MEIRFKLNTKNEKDQVIINVLQGEYSPAETIKNILYKMGTNGVEGQRVSSGGLGDDSIVITGKESDTICDNNRIIAEELYIDQKCRVRENEDIAHNFL